MTRSSRLTAAGPLSGGSGHLQRAARRRRCACSSCALQAPWCSLPCWLWPMLEPPLCRPRCRHTEAAARRAHHSACAHRAPRSDSSECAMCNRRPLQREPRVAGARGGRIFLATALEVGGEETRAEQRPGAEEQRSGARKEPREGAHVRTFHVLLLEALLQVQGLRGERGPPPPRPPRVHVPVINCMQVRARVGTNKERTRGPQKCTG